MSEDTKFFKQVKGTTCFCITKNDYQEVKNFKSDYVKRKEAALSDLSEEEQKKIKVEMASDKGDYVKRGEALIRDLHKNVLDDFIQHEMLSRKVDNTDITWGDIFHTIDEDWQFRLQYLRRVEKRFAHIWQYYNDQEQLSSLAKGKMPLGIETIRTQNEEEIKAEDLTEELIDKIKDAFRQKDSAEDCKAYVDLYDDNAEKGCKLVDNFYYDLSKMNTYKVALVLPVGLFKK